MCKVNALKYERKYEKCQKTERLGKESTFAFIDQVEPLRSCMESTVRQWRSFPKYNEKLKAEHLSKRGATLPGSYNSARIPLIVRVHRCRYCRSQGSTIPALHLAIGPHPRCWFCPMHTSWLQIAVCPSLPSPFRMGNRGCWYCVRALEIYHPVRYHRPCESNGHRQSTIYLIEARFHFEND